MDILLNHLLQFYLNNTLNLRPLTPHIMPSYTHKMAIVSWPYIVTSLHPMYIWYMAMAESNLFLILYAYQSKLSNVWCIKFLKIKIYCFVYR